MIVEKKKTLILTLLINDEAQLFFEEKRKQYFPAHVNFTTAHITLFHCLPYKDFVIEKIKTIVENTNPFIINVDKIMHYKSFNGYEITSDKLLKLHKNLRNNFINMLSLKDIKPFRPHVTIQNKTTAFKAEKTYQLLAENFTPFLAEAIGVSCWYYCKNKWEKQEDYLFVKNNSAS